MIFLNPIAHMCSSYNFITHTLILTLSVLLIIKFFGIGGKK